MLNCDKAASPRMKEVDENIQNNAQDTENKRNLNGKKDMWFPLSAVKSGKVLLSADFTDESGHEPIWNYEASFLTSDGASQTVHIEVFGSDKIGKDKSLGELSLDLDNVDAMDGQEGRGFPLAETKSGLILLKSDFIGNNSRGLPSALGGKDRTFSVDIFDSDKVGKDESRGELVNLKSDSP